MINKTMVGNLGQYEVWADNGDVVSIDLEGVDVTDESMSGDFHDEPNLEGFVRDVVDESYPSEQLPHPSDAYLGR